MLLPRNAVGDVAANQSQWLVSPLQAKQCFEAMSEHHGQLRAMYGILHLADKIVRMGGVDKSLFLDVHGADAHPELDPVKWRDAVKTDSFFGRFFGFHYKAEMRNFLRLVNIARGSIRSAAETTTDKSSQLVRNLTALGWGWVYSNMVLLNNLGMSIDGASTIGADTERGPVSIQQVRHYMNLAEDAIVSRVTSLASADVAMDFLFEIIPDRHDPVAQTATGVQSDSALTLPIAARFLSARHRPVNREVLERRVSSGILFDQVDETVPRVVHDSLAARNSSSSHDAEEALDSRHTISSEPSRQPESEDRCHHSRARQIPSDPADMPVTATRPVPAPSEVDAEDARLQSQTSRSNTPEARPLASAIKDELARIQHNVATFLGHGERPPATGLIVQFHGGGFVSQSSGGHRVYLQEWLNKVPDAVMVCVDYKLAPEYPYPTALNECVYAYRWALDNASHLGTTANRVVLCGDSAGGNFAVAVALKAQELGLRQPDGICIAYPALYVNVAWSPSRLLAFFDPMLPLSILNICVRAYVPDGENPSENPYMSPLVASPEMLGRLPPCAIVCGAFDPLMDDAVQFIHNLRAAGRVNDVLRLYDSMPHGFLNMMPVFQEANRAVGFLGRKMAEYLSSETSQRQPQISNNAENPSPNVSPRHTSRQETTSTAGSAGPHGDPATALASLGLFEAGDT